MPTLLDRSQALRDLAGRLAAADAEKARFGHLSTRTAQVKEARDALEGAQKAVRLLSARAFRPSPLPRPSTALRGKAPALRAKLTEDWRAFADDGSLPTNFVVPVKAHAAKLLEAALAAWQSHVDAGQPHIRDDLIAALSAAGFQAQCARLKHFRAEIADLRRSCPVSDADFQRLDELKSAIQAIWGELKDIPADVTGFLRKAARREATVADLTPGIRTWLDDHNMLSQLRIGLG